MPANVDGMVREGINAYRAGKKEEARAFLLKAVEIDERNEQAWLWLSAVVDSGEEQQICLENVLAINPGNERARQGIELLKQKAKPAAPPPAAEDVLASVSFTSPAPPPPPAASKEAPLVSPFNAEIEDEIPTSLEWDAPPTASSSASSTRKVNEPSPAEYDDWVSGLNLGGSGGSSLLDEISDAPPPADTHLDEMTKFISGSAFDEDEEEDLFGGDARMPEDLFNGPFSAPETAMPPAIARRDSQPKPPASPASSRAAAPAPKAAAPEESEAVFEDEPEDFISEFEDYDHITMEAPDPAEMFRHIPKEIKATRLPGTNERYPILVILGFLIAIAANIGAVAFLVSRLTGG